MATITSHRPEETYAAGVRTGLELRGGEVLALVGDLGAGKTLFVKGLAAGLGSEAAVTSPSLTLIHEYGDGRVPVYHVDCYRLERAEELAGIGIEEYMDGRGVVVIEWADKFPELMPARTTWVRFEIGEGEERKIMKDEL